MAFKQEMDIILHIIGIIISINPGAILVTTTRPALHKHYWYLPMQGSVHTNIRNRYSQGFLWQVDTSIPFSTTYLSAHDTLEGLTLGRETVPSQAGGNPGQADIVAHIGTAWGLM